MRTLGLSLLIVLLVSVTFTSLKADDIDFPLHQAVKNDDLAAVQSLLSQGLDIEAKDNFGWTPLFEAVWFAGYEMIEFLVDQGADVNARDRDGGTTLHLAARALNPDVVHLFLAHGADLDAVDEERRTALHVAVENGYLPVVQSLVEGGAEINSLDNLGQSPATLAMLDNKRKVVAYLVDHGAEVTLHLAAYLGLDDQAKQLIEMGADIDSKMSIGTALHVAVREENTKLALLLIDRGADVHITLSYEDTRDSNMYYRYPSALHETIRTGDIEVINALLNLDADTHYTLWETAIRKDDPVIIDLLLTEGADYTVHQAARIGDVNRVAQFLNNGADVDAVDKHGRTALHRAAFGGHAQVVELLMQSGATRDSKTKWGKNTPLYYAILLGHVDVVAQLSIFNEEKENALREAALYGHVDLVAWFLDRGADINAYRPGEYRTNALLSAASMGHTEVVSLLLNRGADVDAKNSWGETALHLGVEVGSVDIVKNLLDHGADPNALVVDDNGKGSRRTALFEAALQGHTEVIETLLTHGTNTQVKDDNGYSALEVATHYGFADIVSLLGGDPNQPSFGQWKPRYDILSHPRKVWGFLVWGLVWHTLEYDDLWIPEARDLSGLDDILAAYLKANILHDYSEGWPYASGEHQDILTNLTRYRKEYAGYMLNGTKYILCNMDLMYYPPSEHELNRNNRPATNFTRYFDGGCSLVRVLFNAETGEFLYIECNGYA